MRLLGKLYPWLPPIILALLLVLSLTLGERLRRNTPIGKFNRIEMGMDRERVHEILGQPLLSADRYVDCTWEFENCWIQVRFDHQDKVFRKSIQCYAQAPGQSR